MSISPDKLASMPQPSLIHQLHSQPPVAPAQNQPPVAPADNQAPVELAQNQIEAPPSETPAPAKAVIPEEFKYKNYLQEYTQRECLPLPLYKTIGDGASHSPMFRSTVIVNGTSYTSLNTFPTRKGAEMDVARIALLSVLQRVEEEECTIGQEELTLCKAILKEYADKINAENPIYKTEQVDGSCLAFTSSLTFNGKKYVGEEGRNKKESQHLAARAVILSILDSDARGVISKIIKSKRRMLYSARGKVSNPCNVQNVGNPVAIQTVNHVVGRESNENEPAAADENMVRIALQEACTVNLSSALAEPGASATPNLEQLLAGSTSSKKRKRKAKKAEKNVGNDAQEQVAAVPLNQNTASTDYSDQICAPNSCVSLPGSDNAVLSQT